MHIKDGDGHRDLDFEIGRAGETTTFAFESKPATNSLTADQYPG